MNKKRVIHLSMEGPERAPVFDEIKSLSDAWGIPLNTWAFKCLAAGAVEMKEEFEIRKVAK
jgi:hypothetical protein